MDSIEKAYNEEYDRLNDQFRCGEISLEEFNREVEGLEGWCNEQESLRAMAEIHNGDRPNGI